MKLEINKETLRVLLPEECDGINGGTGLRCLRYGMKGTPLGASSDLCCGSGSCPKKIELPVKKDGWFTPTPKWTPPKDFTKQCGQPQVKKG